MSGLTESGSNDALEGVLPAATTLYLGFFTVLPTARDGTGGTEATGSGYARIGHGVWVNLLEGGASKRANSGAVTFAALTDDLPGIIGVGLWDAVSAGTLKYFGPTRNASGNVVTFNFLNTDQPRFLDQEFKIGIKDDD